MSTYPFLLVAKGGITKSEPIGSSTLESTQRFKRSFLTIDCLRNLRNFCDAPLDTWSAYIHILLTSRYHFVYHYTGHNYQEYDSDNLKFLWNTTMVLDTYDMRYHMILLILWLARAAHQSTWGLFEFMPRTHNQLLNMYDGWILSLPTSYHDGHLKARELSL